MTGVLASAFCHYDCLALSGTVRLRFRRLCGLQGFVSTQAMDSCPGGFMIPTQLVDNQVERTMVNKMETGVYVNPKP